MSNIAKTGLLGHNEVMHVFRQIIGDGIDVYDLTDAEAEATFDYYVLGIAQPTRIQELIDSVEVTHEYRELLNE